MIWDVQRVHEYRKRAKTLATEVRGLMDQFGLDLPLTADPGEMQANIMLAFRHLEDAGMRLGKVIQAYDGGMSVYDKGEA